MPNIRVFKVLFKSDFLDFFNRADLNLIDLSPHNVNKDYIHLLKYLFEIDIKRFTEYIILMKSNSGTNKTIFMVM